MNISEIDWYSQILRPELIESYWIAATQLNSHHNHRIIGSESGLIQLIPFISLYTMLILSFPYKSILYYLERIYSVMSILIICITILWQFIKLIAFSDALTPVRIENRFLTGWCNWHFSSSRYDWSSLKGITGSRDHLFLLESDPLYPLRVHAEADQ